MIVCPHCKAPNSPSALTSHISARCRECGGELIFDENYSRTQKLDGTSGECRDQDARVVPTEVEKKYTLERELGRGGMGAIYSVFEDDIHRTVAMKVMLGTCGPADRLRFIQEAQVTGQLEHPNIVPIHELGVNPDGRPFFTMKMVKGRDLGDVLAKLKAGNRAAESEFTSIRLLAVLVNVCNAVAFAHSKGIVHRDLKPANIMLGSFGEVMVMDWGLAKVIRAKAQSPAANGNSTYLMPAGEISEAQAAADAELNSIVWSYRHESGHGTIQGTIAGTPAYMAPEQARGEISNIDARSDIYALGAILYEILTMSPPARGKNAREILENAGKGLIELPEIAAPNTRIPKELSAIAMKALASTKEERYQSAEDFKNDIERYLQGGSVSARDDSLIESIVKLIKRNKPVFVTAAIFLVVLLAGTGISVQQIWEKKNTAETELNKRLELERNETERKAQIRQEADDAIARGQKLLNQPKGDFESRENVLIEAELQFQRARFLLGPNDHAEEGTRRAFLEHFEIAIANKNWRQAGEKLKQARGANLNAAEFDRRKSALEAAETERSRHIQNRVAALMQDAAQPDRKTTHELASSELISYRDPLTVDLLLPHTHDANANCRALAIDSLAWMGDFRAVPAILDNIGRKLGKDENPEFVQESAVRALCVLAPDDKDVFAKIRARVSDGPGRNESRFYKALSPYLSRYASLMLNRSIAELRLNPESKAGEWFNLGVWCQDANELRLGIECLNKAIERESDNFNFYLFRGGFEITIDSDASLKDFDKGISLNPNFPDAYWNRGKLKARRGDLNGAMADFNKALELNSKHAFVLVERAELLHRQGDMLAAIADCKKALGIDQQNTAAYAISSRAWRDLGAFDSALEDAEKYYAVNQHSAAALYSLGVVKLCMDNYEDAIHDFQQAAQLEPNNPMHFVRMGDAKRFMNEPEQARDYYKQALARDAKNVWASIGLAGEHRDLREYDQALSEITRALAADGESAEALYERGATLDAKGELDAALKDYQHALKSNCRFSPAHKALIVLYGKRRDWKNQDDAFRCWTQTVTYSAEAFNARALHLLTCEAPEFRNARQALEFAQKAAKFSSEKKPAILETLSMALYENGMVQEAIQKLEQAMPMLPSDDLRKPFVERIKLYKSKLATQN